MSGKRKLTIKKTWLEQIGIPMTKDAIRCGPPDDYVEPDFMQFEMISWVKMVTCIVLPNGERTFSENEDKEDHVIFLEERIGTSLFDWFLRVTGYDELDLDDNVVVVIDGTVH